MKVALNCALIALVLIPAGELRADTMSFVNSTNITIRDGNSASLYPSPITVSGMVGLVSQVTVTLNGLSHAQPSDIDMLLVGPTGAKLVLFSDAGGNNSVSGTFTLDDTAASWLPSSFLSSGTYKPTDYGGVADTFLSPAPSIAFPGDSAAPTGTATLTSKFSGADPNGAWSLYIMDDTTNGLSGSLSGGWEITVTTVGGLHQPILTNAVINASGEFQFGFNGVTTTNYSVLTSTNLTNWNILGTATEISAGKFQFIDTQPRTNAVRFYRVRSP